MSTTKAATKKSSRDTELAWLNGPEPELSKLSDELNRLKEFLFAQELAADRPRWLWCLGIVRLHRILAPHGGGEFKKFVEGRLGYSISYAHQAIRCVATWKDCAAEIRDQIPFSALLVLSNSGCAAAIAEAKELAAHGRVTVAAAQELVAKHRNDAGRANKASVKKVEIPGLCTLVLHRVKGSDSSSLSELLQAIERLAKQFSPSKEEAVA